MSDVFQEVDEELKRQHLDKVMRRYGPWAGSVAVAVVVGFAGFSFWQSYEERSQAAAGDALVAGMELVVAGDTAEAADTFSALATDAPGGYRLLARFQEAAAWRLDGDFDRAIMLYDEIAADEETPLEYRELAQFFAGLAVIGRGTVRYDDVESRLSSIATGTGLWRYQALEALAFAAYSTGQFALAASTYRQITDDALAPAGIAARANEMLNFSEASASAD